MQRRLLLGALVVTALSVPVATGVLGNSAALASSMPLTCSKLSGAATGTAKLKKCDVANTGDSGSFSASGLSTGSIQIKWKDGNSSQVSDITVITPTDLHCPPKDSIYQATGTVTTDTTQSLLADAMLVTYCVTPAGKLSLQSRGSFSFSPLASIAVTPANPSTSQGGTIGLTATGTYANGSSQELTTVVNWASTNTNVATVSNTSGSQGVVSATDTSGMTTVEAMEAAVTGSTTVTVTCRLHSNGLGQQYSSCDPLGTYNASTALGAATAWNAEGNSYFIQCSAGTSIGYGVEDDATPSGPYAVWLYSGTGIYAAAVGHVDESSSGALCPIAGDPSWN